ncbi:hypothetical protein HOY82DRAFT_643432 [Tuber indicum]|nr:hypothetical protein HOY82DRAFT_643432 [Tuber indicum]
MSSLLPPPRQPTPTIPSNCQGGDRGICAGMRERGSEEPLDPLVSIQMLVTAFQEKTHFDRSHIPAWFTGGENLKLNEKTGIQVIPILLSTLRNITQVSASTNHVLGLTRGGNIYAWAMVSNFNPGDVRSREPVSMGSLLLSSVFLGVRSSVSLPSPTTPSRLPKTPSNYPAHALKTLHLQKNQIRQ